MKNKKKKAQAMKEHARKRAMERYGMELTEPLYNEFCNWIKTGDPRAVFLEKQSLRVSLWAFRHKEQWLPIIYDKVRHTLVSVLPQEVLTVHKKKLGKEEQHECTV